MHGPDSEIFTAFSVGESRDTTIATLKRTALRTSVAASEQKYLVAAAVSDAPEITSLVERRFDTVVVVAWSALRQAGLTVAPALYTRPAAGRQYMADVKQNGAEVYGRHISFVHDPAQGGVRIYPRPEIDQTFLEILDSQAAEVWGTMQERVALATAAGIRLAGDDPFELMVAPDGAWDHISLDLELTEFPRPGTLAAQNLADDNANIAWTYRERVEYLAGALQRSLE